MIFTSVYADPLALRLKAYPTEEAMLSAVPRENTVGVVTDKMDRWLFSPREPEGEEGLLWITTGNASAAACNALKKNGIELCPVEARQYREGAWQRVAAASYLGGSWLRWAANRTIYASGVSHVGLTLTNATKSDNGYLALSLGLNGSAKAVSDPVLLAGQARLVVEYQNLGGSGTFAGGVRARVWDLEDEVVASSNRKTAASGVLTLDISGLSGEYKVGVYANNSSGSYTGSCRVTAISILMDAEEA